MTKISRASRITALALLATAFGAAPAGAADRGAYDYDLSLPSGSGELIHARNVEVPTRDGRTLLADVYRPPGAEPAPVIMNMAPYPRAPRWEHPEAEGVDDPGGATDHLHFEMPNPDYWVRRGYAFVTVTSPGFDGSPAAAEVSNREEAESYYDAIEWAAKQPWSTGRIGLYGISYYAFSQYWVATLKPPHLEAIVPWEGLARPYYDICYQGGIFNSFCGVFGAALDTVWPTQPGRTTYLADMLSHPLFDAMWAEFTNPDLDKLDIPMLAVGNLEDINLHLGGGVDAYNANRSPDKRLLLYHGTHWGSAYQPWATREVLRFFDHWLKRRETGLDREPPVHVHLRTGSTTFEDRYAAGWPIPGTSWTQWYLSPGSGAHDGKLSEQVPSDPGGVRMISTAEPEANHQDGVSFTSTPLDHDVDVAGPVTAHLWVSSDQRDGDVMAEVEDIAPDGRSTRFGSYFAGEPDEPVTRGRLRISLRAEDQRRTSPHDPVHPQTRNEYLEPGEVVPLNIKLFPTAMRFAKGHRIKVTFRGNDYIKEGQSGFNIPDTFMPGVALPQVLPTQLNAPAYQGLNLPAGEVTFHTGPDTPSSLELPTLPAQTEPTFDVAVRDDGFAPATARVPLGARVRFTNRGRDYRSATDSSGLGLWDSQLLQGARSHFTQTWSVAFPWASSYRYHDRVAGNEAAIAVPPQIRKARRPTTRTRVRLRLGVAPLPTGAMSEVAIRRDRGRWRVVRRTRSRSIALRPGAYGPGRYRVRARLRSTTGRGATRWSPAVAVRVSAPGEN